jgi:ribosomal subunit interface protein
MNLDVRGVNVPVSRAVEGHVERRIIASLRRFLGRVERVTVRLMDINGSRGGADKRVRVAVGIAGAPDVVVQETSPDLYHAVDAAAARTKQTVARVIDKTHTTRRK